MPLVTLVASNGAGGTCELRVALYRRGCIKQRWTVEQEGGFVRIRGEDVGIVLVGGWDCPSWAPVNPATGTEYFKIGRADLQFALERLGGVVCFETVPELAPLNPDEAGSLQQRILEAHTRLVQAQLELKRLEMERFVGPRGDVKSDDADASDRIHEQMNAAVASVDVTACGATVTYRIRAGERELEASAFGVDPAEIESAVRALRRALSGKA